jgi:uncharacterized membrane protein
METTRLEAFSDGVFAIAITLLIVAIEVPSPEPSLGVALARLWPSHLAYAISFIVIGAIYVGLNLFYLWPKGKGPGDHRNGLEE